MKLPIQPPIPAPYAGVFGFHPDPRGWVKGMGQETEWRVYFHANGKRATITEIELANPDNTVPDLPVTAVQLADVIDMYRDWEDRLEETLAEHLRAAEAYDATPA